MTVTHTNRRGNTYYLHQGKTKSGNPKYFFALRDEGDLVDDIPAGYEVYENPNAQVFLRRVPAKIVTDEEVAVVKAGMQQFCRLKQYIVDVKKEAILIYTPDQDVDLLTETLDIFSSFQRTRARAMLERALSYSPVLKFVLADKEKRLFTAWRYCYLGSIDDWIPIDIADVLSKLVAKYVKHVGQETFYDLN